MSQPTTTSTLVDQRQINHQQHHSASQLVLVHQQCTSKCRLVEENLTNCLSFFLTWVAPQLFFCYHICLYFASTSLFEKFYSIHVTIHTSNKFWSWHILPINGSGPLFGCPCVVTGRWTNDEGDFLNKIINLFFCLGSPHWSWLLLKNCHNKVAQKGSTKWNGEWLWLKEVCVFFKCKFFNLLLDISVPLPEINPTHSEIKFIEVWRLN